MDRFGTFVVWYRDYPGKKRPLHGVDGTEADARGDVHEYAMIPGDRPKGREYGYMEINQRVRAFAWAMAHNELADGRYQLAKFTEEEHEQLELWGDLMEQEKADERYKL